MCGPLTSSGPHRGIYGESPVQEGRATARAVLVGTMIAMDLAIVNPYTAYVSRTWDYGCGTLPKGPVVIAFLLVAANGLALRLRFAIVAVQGPALALFAAVVLGARGVSSLSRQSPSPLASGLA